MKFKTSLNLIALALAAASLSANSFAQEAIGSGIVVSDCLVKAIDDNRESVGADGLMRELMVRESQRVTKGQVIATQDTIQAELNLKLKEAEVEQARLQAENDVNIRAAEKSMEYELAEAKAAEELYKKQAMPYWDMRREVLEAERSKLAIELARNEQLVAKATHTAKLAELDLAKHEIEKRKIKASFDGVIATIYGKEGEWVQAGTPIARVIRLDKLKVEGDANALNNPNEIRVGASVKIRFTVAGQVLEMTSQIGHVEPIFQGDDTFRVWAEFDNPREIIKPGMPAEMMIIPSGPAALQ